MNVLRKSGYQWHYTLTGDRSLPPLLLLHGWMGNGADYAGVIELLRSRFYCIAIDLPGHGKTEVIGDDRYYEFIATTTGIIQLLDSLQIDRCTIAGYSFGGRLSLYLALEFPDRFDRVILESTSPGLSTLAERLDRDRFADFIDNWYRQPIFTGIDRHPDFPKLIQRRLTNQPSKLAKSLYYAGLGRQSYLGDRLAEYNRPVLLIVGAEDCKFRAIAQTLDLTCHCTTLKIVPNSSHNVHFQQPELWIDALVFASQNLVSHIPHD
jgi:2-succinyl-6-hydroxy-2,4-cyclohexadiene-1-carboxylate synthase